MHPRCIREQTILFGRIPGSQSGVRQSVASWTPLQTQVPPSQFPYALLKSYTEGREFQVRCGSLTSTTMPIRDEVPQGSVLGPILYTLFTAHLPIIPSRYLTAATYADDTAFLATATNPQLASVIIQRQLDALDPWLKRWNIVINADNSSYTTFSLRRVECPPVSLDGDTIPPAPPNT